MQRHESRELIKRLEVRRVFGADVLDPAAQASGDGVGIQAELDEEHAANPTEAGS